MSKILVLFDFDNTIIDGNSDTHIFSLSPGSALPNYLNDICKDKGWNVFMAEVCKYLHRECGVPRQHYEASLAEIPLVAGIKELFTWLKNEERMEVGIVSDANTFFIRHLLSVHGLLDTVPGTNIHSNPASFDPDGGGVLSVTPYHTQDWCSLSAENMCKGWIVDEMVAPRGTRGAQGPAPRYARVVYVGDGKNDLCPALRLTPRDYVCARQNYSLPKAIRKWNSQHSDAPDKQLQANLLVWSDARQILELLKTL